MVGNTEKRRKILLIWRFDNVIPPKRLPQTPPKAIADQERDWRSPANAALINKKNDLS